MESEKFLVPKSESTEYSEEEVVFITDSENQDHRPPTQEEIDVAAEFIRSSGQDPESVAYSVYLSREKDEKGNAIEGGEIVANSGWLKKTKVAKSLAINAIEMAKPAHITASRTPRRTRRQSDKVALIIPDIQLGYRRIDEELDPIHDIHALEVAHMLARHIQPDIIAFNGDNADLPNMSKHGNDPAAAGTLNLTTQGIHNEMAQFRADAPNARMVYLYGNHEDRLMRYLRDHAPELSGVRQASEVAGKLGELALTFENLIAAKSLDVEILQAYPAGKFWLNDRIKVIHGNTVESGSRSTAAKILKQDPHSSTIFGHIHRMESQSKTIEDGRRGARKVSAHSFGTLSRIDGGVPSVGWARDDSDRAVTNFENWQQGVGMIEFREGDNPYHVTPIAINTHDGYLARFDGRDFTPNIPKH